MVTLKNGTGNAPEDTEINFSFKSVNEPGLCDSFWMCRITQGCDMRSQLDVAVATFKEQIGDMFVPYACFAPGLCVV